MSQLDLLTGDARAFVEEAWGRRIHVHTLSPDEVAGLLDIEQADHLITQTAIRTPQIRLAKDGAVLPESQYTRQATIAGKPMTGLIDPTQVLNLFSDGATIVFQGLQRYWEPLRRRWSVGSRRSSAILPGQCLSHAPPVTRASRCTPTPTT